MEGMIDIARPSFVLKHFERKENMVCAEIGVWTGKNAESMLSINPTMQLYVIDSYDNIGITDDKSEGDKEEVKKKAKIRLNRFGNRVKFIYKQSEVAYLDFPDEFFDYVYIDGDHSYWGCYRDIRIWYPKVKKGGMIAGHDVGMTTVSKAILDFLIDNTLFSQCKKVEKQGRSDWWIIKKDK